jgi:hypothetical protein
MIIQPSLPADAAADLQKNRLAGVATGTSNSGSSTNATDPSLNRMRELSLAEADGEFDAGDSSTADSWTNFLSSSMGTQGGTVLAAQANLNPATAYSLLQSSPK